MKTLINTALLASAAILHSAFAQTAPPPPNIETVIRDMSTANEAIALLPTFDWQHKPSITQYAPTGTVLPKWWTGNRPEWCYTLNTWYTVFEAGGTGGQEAGKNAATNTRVQVRNLRIYLWSEAMKRWTHADTALAPQTSLWEYPFKNASASLPVGLRPEATGGQSMKPAYPYFHHGWGKSLFLNAPWDIRAVYVAMEFRLVADKSTLPDDSAKARYVVNVGADYWPGQGGNWGVNYAPGVASGRYLLATNQWRTATILVPNTALGASMDEMRRFPPPLDVPAAP